MSEALASLIAYAVGVLMGVYFKRRRRDKQGRFVK